MSNLKTIVPKADRAFLAKPERIAPEDPKQHKLMVGALCLLLLSLGIVVWHDRDFWFANAHEAESSQAVESSPVAEIAPLQAAVPAAKNTRGAKTKHAVTSQVSATPAPAAAPPAAATTTRTVLPPLEVEIVAGDSHRTIQPGNTSVRVDLQPGIAPQPIPEAVGAENAATVTRSATERVHLSADTSEIVTSPVSPNYPLLARQMKVQGSVILQAMISKDGTIQNLRVMSGPHILASAAQDAVRQWHFRPHFQGNEAVETQAKITVNFTISTN
jgi:TonB family protein